MNLNVVKIPDSEKKKNVENAHGDVYMEAEDLANTIARAWGYTAYLCADSRSVE